MPEPDEQGAVVIQIVGLVNGGQSPFDGKWLVEYDPTRPGVGPNGEPLRAHLVCTVDRKQARRFAGMLAARDCWRAESGNPYPADRPLHAYNILIERLDDDHRG